MPEASWTDRYGVTWTWSSSNTRDIQGGKGDAVQGDRAGVGGRVKETVKRMNSKEFKRPITVYLSVPDSDTVVSQGSGGVIRPGKSNSGSSPSLVEPETTGSANMDYLEVDNKLRKSSSKTSLSSSKNSLLNLFRRNK